MKRLAIIGLGNMGSALVRGLVSSGKTLPAMIRAFDIDSDKCRTIVEELGVEAVPGISDAVTPDIDTVILAVKPQVIGPVLESIAHQVHERLVIISIAAGITTAFILSKLKGPARVIRAMPNAAAMVSAGATAVCKAGTADDKDLAVAVDLFNAVGTAVIVDEKMMNVVTALSGSGPGYLFIIMEALTDGGVLMGLDRPTARTLAVQTVLGAATMATSGKIPFSELKDRITSPGGTTIAGLQILESGGLRGLIMDAIEAATLRAEELQASK
ncbi:MAG: pyrroline-5-carboxylate reductase [Desulfomonilaceae bacterium]